MVSADSMIHYEVSGRIATIILDKPAKLNAFTRAAMRDMIAAFDRLGQDDSVRAIVVAGEARAFCAGTDLSAGASTFEFRIVFLSRMVAVHLYGQLIRMITSIRPFAMAAAS